MHATYTLGWLFGLPVGILLTVVGLVLLIWGITRLKNYYRKDHSGYSYSHADGSWAMAVGGGLVFVIALILTLILEWPLNPAYHKWEPTSGKVVSVAYQVQGDSNSVYRDFTLTLEGKQNVYTCGDSRCSIVKAGDHVDLMCVKQNIYASTDTYDCRLVRLN